jgi:hypothetical protein
MHLAGILMDSKKSRVTLDATAAQADHRDCAERFAAFRAISASQCLQWEIQLKQSRSHGFTALSLKLFVARAVSGQGD